MRNFIFILCLMCSSAQAGELVLPQRVADAVVNDVRPGVKAKNTRLPLDTAIKHRQRIVNHLDTNDTRELLIYLLLTN